MELIRIRGARTHNLKSVDLDIPRGALVVITGPSGCGKSSLAFDTIYAEGRRRYIESLTVSARRVLGGAGRPPVDSIEGLSPAIAVSQGFVGRSPRSTVGTVSELDDHLRLLLARVGEVRCPGCGEVVAARSPSEIVDEVMALGEGARAMILAPLARRRVGPHDATFASLRREGFVRVRLNGDVVSLDELPELDDAAPLDLDLVVDRVVVRASARARVLDAVELALQRGDGAVRVAAVDGPELALTTRFACSACDRVLPEITPALLSFNSPAGACPRCQGLGTLRETSSLVRDPARSLRGGALAPWKKDLPEALLRYAQTVGVDLDLPWRDLSPRAREEILLGDGDDFPGVASLAEGADDEALSRFAPLADCDLCQGARLRPEARVVRVADADMVTLSREPLVALRARLRGYVPPARHAEVAQRVLSEVLGRLDYLIEVGVGYLSLDRAAPTLSSGEGQRVRLATQLGGALSGVLYVLDEPTRGLHPKDRARLRGALRALVARGNSVLVVEHDLDTVRAADYVVDMGPGAGVLGGEVLASGSPAEVEREPRSVTAPWLRRVRALPRHTRSPAAQGHLSIRGARAHNLRGVSAEIPFGALTAVTGVSGSGKTSLVLGTLVPHLRARIAGAPEPPAAVDAITGAERIQRVVAVDALPLTRSARSIPATLLSVLDPLRELFASLPEAKARGFRASRFSFNARGGRCERCRGEGVTRVAMQFLADVTLPCDACGGRRYEPETLAVAWRGMSIADVLSLTVDDALAQFEAHPKIRAPLRALHDVGLGYLRLAQSASTLSGGEAQRVRLARELVRRTTADTLYVLDEPTAGLHRDDIEALTDLLQSLVAEGATVVVIEHDPAVIALADHIIDLGPGAGPEGGAVTVAGDLATVLRCETSATAAALRAHLSA